MNSQRIRPYTFAIRSSQQHKVKLQAVYVLPTLSEGWKIKNEMTSISSVARYRDATLDILTVGNIKT